MRKVNTAWMRELLKSIRREVSTTCGIFQEIGIFGKAEKRARI
jgi:hypothetical protein